MENPIRDMEKLQEAQEYWLKIGNLCDFSKSLMNMYENEVYASPWHTVPFSNWHEDQKVLKNHIKYMISQGFFVSVYQPSASLPAFKAMAFIEGPIKLSILKPFIKKLLNINSKLVVVCSSAILCKRVLPNKGAHRNQSKKHGILLQRLPKIGKFKYEKETKIHTYTCESNNETTAFIYHKPTNIHCPNYVSAINYATNSIHLTEIVQNDEVLVPTRCWLAVNANRNLAYIKNASLIEEFLRLTTWIHVIDPDCQSKRLFDDVQKAFKELELENEGKSEEKNDENPLENDSMPNPIAKEGFDRKKETPIYQVPSPAEFWKKRHFDV